MSTYQKQLRKFKADLEQYSRRICGEILPTDIQRLKFRDRLLAIRKSRGTTKRFIGS